MLSTVTRVERLWYPPSAAPGALDSDFAGTLWMSCLSGQCGLRRQ